MWSVWEAESPHFAGIRYLVVLRYPNYVVFYRPLSDGVEIPHILHGARDLGAILDAERP
jgi:hypothetical protein